MTDTTAIIRWIPAERGGRKAPPASAVGYSTLVRFEGDPAFEASAWSLKIVSSQSLRDPECIVARVELLAPHAPAELLAAGERFELLEGRKVVAKGVVMPQRLSVPATVSDFELALLG